jgi:hypothetical protein
MGTVYLTDFGPIVEDSGGSGASAAEDVSYGGAPGMSATDVEAALDELAGDVAALQNVTRTLWTPGGANDLGDWATLGVSARVTDGTGTDANGNPAVTQTVAQSAVPPTLWTEADSAQAGWFSPLIACEAGQLLRCTFTSSWDRTANSLVAPGTSQPSLLADTLSDESARAVRCYFEWYDDPGGNTVYAANTDIAFVSSSGWMFDGTVHSQTYEFTVIDPTVTGVYLDIYFGPVWGNAAGVVALSSVVLEVVTL